MLSFMMVWILHLDKVSDHLGFWYLLDYFTEKDLELQMFDKCLNFTLAEMQQPWNYMIRTAFQNGVVDIWETSWIQHVVLVPYQTQARVLSPRSPWKKGGGMWRIMEPSRQNKLSAFLGLFL